jgi:isopentenyldiphosphate isomerase
MPADQELFQIVDTDGRVIGMASRRACHSNPALRHRVVHVLVRDSSGRLFLQKRSETKDIQPGKWDTSVGGHLRPNEDPLTGADRELEEELGIQDAAPEFLYRYEHRSSVETELVDTFGLCWDGDIRCCPEEISEGRWWRLEEIRAVLGTGACTPNFEEEFARWQDRVEKRLRKTGVSE